jgi:hypothetical protein
LRELCTHFERASGGGFEADGVEERVEVVQETLIEAIELMSFVLGKSRIGRDRSEQSGG